MTSDIDPPWQTSPNLRAQLLGLAREKRHAPTPTEDRLWQVLRRHNLGSAKFRRQHNIGPFIVDFYCAAARLVVEIDGSSHDGHEEEDALRQAFLEESDRIVLRFSNEEVMENVGAILTRIRQHLSNLAEPTSSPLHRNGEG